MSDTMTEQDLPPIRDRMCDAVGKHRKRIRDAIDDTEGPWDRHPFLIDAEVM